MNQDILLKVSEDDPDVAYLYLAEHPGVNEKCVVCRQIRLLDLIENYKGPDIYLDFDREDTLIGVEILGQMIKTNGSAC